MVVRVDQEAYGINTLGPTQRLDYGSVWGVYLSSGYLSCHVFVPSCSSLCIHVPLVYTVLYIVLVSVNLVVCFLLSKVSYICYI